MTKYLLTQWEAIELFCKVVYKYEKLIEKTRENKILGIENQVDLYENINIKLDKFNNNTILMQTLHKYENPTFYREFGDVYMKRIASDEAIPRHYPKTLYNLSLEIRLSQPIVRTVDELLLLLIFIGERHTIDQYRTLNMWQPSDRQRTFENTRWWLYYYEEFFDHITQEKQAGITRAFVHLKPFAKLSIIDVNASEDGMGKEEKYSGSYRIYGGIKGNYLLLEARLKNDQSKDLHILLYIGDNTFVPGEIALGQYHDVNNTIYSGTVIMELVSQPGSMKPAFFKKGDENIPQVYWDFFRNKFKNRIRVKAGIRSKGGLQKWINTKKNQNPDNL